MKNLSKIAIDAFNQGSDNFGEKPTGEVSSLTREILSPNAICFGSPNPKSHEYYHCSVQLVQPDGHKCTSSIGFYVKDNVMDVCSGHIVFSIPVTDEIQAELNVAEVFEW